MLDSLIRCSDGLDKLLLEMLKHGDNRSKITKTFP
jgi:hypothetical protein